MMSYVTMMSASMVKEYLMKTGIGLNSPRGSDIRVVQSLSHTIFVVFLTCSLDFPSGIEEGTKVMTRMHYTLVKNMSTLVNDKSKCNGKVYVCPNYLHRFTKKRLLDAHEPDCMTHKPCRIRFSSNKVKPSKENFAGDDDDFPDMADVEQIEDLLQIDSDVSQI